LSVVTSSSILLKVSPVAGGATIKDMAAAGAHGLVAALPDGVFASAIPLPE
jgi:hypothetical protein